MKGRKHSAPPPPENGLIHYRAVRDMPELGLKAGDSLSHDPADLVEPYLAHRPVAVPDGLVDRALAWGILEVSSGATPTRPLAPAPRLRLVK